MSYVFHVIAVLAFGFPAMFVGYVWTSAVSGFKAGVFIYERDEDKAVAKFTKTKGPQL